MAQWAVAPAKAGRVAYRAIEILACLDQAARSSRPSARFAAIAEDRVQPVPCVCGVSMRGPRSSKCPCRRARDVDRFRAVEVAPLDEYDARAELQDPVTGAAHVIERPDGDPGQHLGFGHIGRHDVCPRQQFGLDRVNGLWLEEPVSALGHHHGIDDNVGQVELGDCGGDRFDDGGTGEHADLDGIGADVAGDGFDLRSYQVGLDRLAT